MPANRLSPSERALAGRIGAHRSWANTENRSARTSKGRRAFEQKFVIEAKGDLERAESLRKEFYARLALKSAQVRRRRADGDAA
jgi:hypothetical protein